LIRFEDVWKTLDGRAVLRGLDFEVRRGEIFVLMGPSGTGKSVTLKHIIGLHRPDRGRVLVDGRDVAHLDARGLTALRRSIGYLFQEGALLAGLTVGENVALPLRELTDLPDAEIRARVRRTLALVKLEDAYDRTPAVLSGGMRKRVALARALISDPRIVLYDEPNSGLDPRTSLEVNRLIVRVRDTLGVTSVVVTHRLDCAVTVGDEIAILEAGRFLAKGTPAEFRQPKDPTVRTFLGMDDSPPS
jgi:phospholipid/cholesterol/gamma-HCH transport system ATP-binding protein